MTVKPRRFGVVAVVFRAPHFLVIRRSQKVSAPGTYCFPGGGIEAGETEGQALVRELEEELAIVNATPIRKVWHSVTSRNVDLAWWLTEFDESQTLTADPDEVAEVHWWTVEEMHQSGNLLDSNLDFLTRLANGEIIL